MALIEIFLKHHELVQVNLCKDPNINWINLHKNLKTDHFQRPNDFNSVGLSTIALITRKFELFT